MTERPALRCSVLYFLLVLVLIVLLQWPISRSLS